MFFYLFSFSLSLSRDLEEPLEGREYQKHGVQERINFLLLSPSLECSLSLFQSLLAFKTHHHSFIMCRNQREQRGDNDATAKLPLILEERERERGS